MLSLHHRKMFGKIPLTVSGKVDDGEFLVCLSQIKVVTISGGRNLGRRNSGRRISIQFSTCSIRSLNTRSYRFLNKEYVESPPINFDKIEIVISGEIKLVKQEWNILNLALIFK